MWNSKIFCSLFICVVLSTIKTEADTSACEQKETHLAILDLAKESISKAKDLQPTCVSDDKDISANASECGAKEKVSAFLDIAMNLIEKAKTNYTACDVNKKITDVIVPKKSMDCLGILENGNSKSGVYTIWPTLRSGPLKVYCDMDTDGGGWTMIQRRGSFSKKVDFYRDWNDYKFGFGNISEEFWIGNENIYALTNQGSYSLRFDMRIADNEYRFAAYSSFWIEDESEGYMLHFDDYSGTAGDGISSSKDTKFSTKDKRNDKYKEDCSSLKKGGWWYSDCGFSNPNGINVPGEKGYSKYINWHTLNEVGSLPAIDMKIRSE